MSYQHKRKKWCAIKSDIVQVGTRSNKQKYERTIARNICRRKKREYYKHNMEESNSYNINKGSRKFYKEIHMKTKEYNAKLTAC